MRAMTLLAFLCATAVTISGRPAMSQTKEPDYPLPPESVEKEGVPKGKIEGPFQFRSQIFPGTIRDYWVYVPAGYNSEKPPALMVVQDGLGMAVLFLQFLIAVRCAAVRNTCFFI